MNKTLPTISVLTPSFNCEKNLEECYKRIRAQDYPQEHIELILLDGGSEDKTREVGFKYGAKLMDTGSKYRYDGERRMYLGFLDSKNEILAYINSDNFMVGKDWLKKMVKPFIKDKEIIATSPLRYHYDSKDSLINRYFSLFGVNDIVAFYLGKADKLSWLEDKWNLLGEVLEENQDYYKIKFNVSSLPTVGNNGFLVRRSVYKKIKCGPDKFFHIDVNYDLVKMGFDIHGIVKTDLIHIIGDNLVPAIKKRIVSMETYHQRLSLLRRYKLFDYKNRKDRWNLFKFVLYSVTFVEPFYRSLKGYSKIKDIAWFIHPFVCISFLFTYSYVIIKAKIKKIMRWI